MTTQRCHALATGASGRIPGMSVSYSCSRHASKILTTTDGQTFPVCGTHARAATKGWHGVHVVAEAYARKDSSIRIRSGDGTTVA